MAKALKIVGIVVGAVALIATGIGAVLGTGLLLGMTAATFTTIGVLAGVAGGVLALGQQVLASNKNPSFSTGGNPLQFQTNPQSGLPYAMGRTRMSGLRVHADTYDAPTFASNGKDDVLSFIALLSAGGPHDAIEKFTANSDEVTFDGTTGAATSSPYAGYMAQKWSLGLAGASALALAFGGAGLPGWTSAHKLSGMAHAAWDLRFDEKGDVYGAGVPEPAWIGRWAKVYDPRKDSTYPGGSGAHRALNEATYEWSRNPYLHALTWALGRWQNGKKVLGVGAPISNIRVADFVAGANIADTNHWWLGGVEYTTEAPWSVLKRMLQAGGGEPTMQGAMIGCMVNTPRVAIATVQEADLLDELVISATKSRRDRFNTVIPRYRSEDHDWQVISGAPVTSATYVTQDGGPRTKEIDYPLVQHEVGQTGVDGNVQAGQLAAYEIVNSREGTVRLTVGPKFLGVRTGDCVTLNAPNRGLSNQPVIIRSIDRDPATLKIRWECETETSAKHAFALGQTTTPPPTWSPTAPDLTPTAPLSANWTLSSLSLTGGQPALRLIGASDYPGADVVVVQFKRHADLTWSTAGEFPAGQALNLVASQVDSATSYDVQVAHKVGKRVGPFTVLGPVTTPVAYLSGVASSIVGQGALATQSAVTWTTQVTGTGKPEDNADVTGTHTASSIAGQGALATMNNVPANYLRDFTAKPLTAAAQVQGRDLLSLSGTVSYNASAVGPALQAGTAFVEMDIPTNVNGYVMIGLDDDTTSYDYPNIYWLLVYHRPTGVWNVYNGATGVFSGTVAANLTGRIGLYHNGFRLIARVGDTQLFNGGTSAPPAGGFVPKWWAYEPGQLAKNLDAGVFPADAKLGSNVYLSDGATIGTDGTLVTSLGTAAGIVGQGALATLNSVTWAGQVTGKPIVGAEAVTADERFVDPAVWGLTESWFSSDGADRFVYSTAGGSAQFVANYANATPIDHGATYEAYWRLLEETAGTPTGRAYLVVCLWASDGTIITGDGTYWYYPLSYQTLSRGNTFERFARRFGKGTDRPFPANAVRFSLGVLANYAGTGNPMRIYPMWARKIESEALVPNQTSNLTANGLKQGDRTAILTQGNFGSWGNGVYGKFAIKGPCRLEALVIAPIGAVWPYSMMGIATDATPTHYNQMEAAWFQGSAGQYTRYWANATDSSLAGTTSAAGLTAARWAIVYDGLFYRWEKDGVEQGSPVFAGPDLVHRMCFDTPYEGGGYIDVSFTPGKTATIVGTNTYRGSDGNLYSAGDLVTILGTSAAITGQGALATMSNVPASYLRSMPAKPTNIGYSEVRGNDLVTIGAPGYETGAQGPAFQNNGNAAFVECDIITDVNGYCMVGLDPTDGNYSYPTIQFFLHYYRPTGSWNLYNYNSNIASGTTTANLTGRIGLYFNGFRLLAVVGKIVLANIAISASSPLYPKWWTYSGGTAKNLTAGTYPAGAKLGSDIYLSDGTTLGTDGSLVTAMGTAAAIAGQGWGATASEEQAGNTRLEGGVRFVRYPGGGSYSENSGGLAGRLKVCLPAFISPTSPSDSAMIRFKVDVYNYDTGNSVTYIISGYVYGPGTRAWINTSAHLIGANAVAYNIDFGTETIGGVERFAISIGENTTTWNYPQVRVYDLQVGYNTFNNAGWDNDWVVFRSASALTTTYQNDLKPKVGDALFGENVLKNGSTVATLASFETILGTASAITGQGALATMNSVGPGQINPGVLTDNIVRDPVFLTGSASGWFLTGTVNFLSATAFGAPMPAAGALYIPDGAPTSGAYANNASTVPFAGAANGRVHLSADFYSTGGTLVMGYLNLNCYDRGPTYISTVSVPITNAAYSVWERHGGWVTVPANTTYVLPSWSAASAPAGTGNLYMTGMRVSNTELAADVTSNVQSDLGPEIFIAYDYTNTIKAGQVNPRYAQFRMIVNGADRTEDAAWDIPSSTGTWGGTLSTTAGSKGQLNVTSFSSNSTLTIRAQLTGNSRTFVFKLTKKTDDPPSTGGGGSGGAGSAYGNISASIGGTTHAAASDELTVTVGSGGQVVLSGNYTFTCDNLSGSRGMYAKWQWWNGSSWVDLQTEVGSSSNYLASTGEPGEGSVNYTHTGLTASSSQKYRISMRGTNGFTTSYPTGDCSAVAS